MMTSLQAFSRLLLNKLLCPVPGCYSLILWKTGRPGTQPVISYGLPWLQRVSQPTNCCRIVDLHAG